jgi:glycerophosphoryl diester phosphodiesterase
MTKIFHYIIGSLWLLTLLLAARWRKKSSPSKWPAKKWILGHRGARAIAPENTIASFRKAMECGADGVEFDVILSKDAVPVVIHDDTLERTTNGTGMVSNYTAMELAKLDATKLIPGFTKEGVPSLADSLASLPDGAITNIELKSAGRFTRSLLVEKVLFIAQKHEHRLVIIFSSFDGELLSLLRARAPHHTISLLLSPRDHHWPWSLKYWNAIKPDALHLPPQLAGTITQALAQKARLPVAIWTVNDPLDAKKYFDQGVNGIFTDRVPEIIQAREEKVAR